MSLYHKHQRTLDSTGFLAKAFKAKALSISILRVFSLLSISNVYRLPSACYHGSWLRQNSAQWIPRLNGT